MPAAAEPGAGAERPTAIPLLGTRLTSLVGARSALTLGVMMQPSTNPLNALLKAPPLSEIRFVHDYIQLVFDEYTLNVYNAPRLLVDDQVIERPEDGFCDRLVDLIGQRVTAVVCEPDVADTFVFGGGASLSIRLDESSWHGPESFSLSGPGDLLVVGTE